MMEDKIRKYVESHFAGASMRSDTEELKEELIVNLIDKYHDLVAAGQSPESAYEAVIAGIGDLDEMLKELGAKKEQRYYSPGSTAAPEKESHTARNVILAILGILLFLVLVTVLLIFLGIHIFGFVADEVRLGDFVNGIFWYNDEEAVQQTAEYRIAMEGITSFELDWAAGYINVETYDGNEIILTETSRQSLSGSRALSYTINNGRLKIEFSRLSANFNKSLVVLIPASLSFSELKVNAASGNLSIDDVSADQVYLNCASGKITLTNITAKALNIESASGGIRLSTCNIDSVRIQALSGRIDMSGSFDRIDIVGLSGGVEIESLVCPSYFDVETVSGGVTLRIPDNAGFTVRLEGINAKVDSDFPLIYQGSSMVYGDGGASFRVQGINGTFIIREITNPS